MATMSISGSALRTTPRELGVERGGRYSLSVPSNVRKLTAFTLGVFAVVAIANIPGAKAGPLAYTECIKGCIASGIPAWAAAVICLPALATPQ